MTDFIYSRVSTDGQTTDGQLVGLQARFPTAKVVSEVASGAKSRPMLKALVDGLQAGDRLIVAALDRLGRRCSEVLRLIEDLQARGVTLLSVREGVDYSTPTGRLVTQIMVSISEMERALIAERTRASLRAVREAGTKLGRPPLHSQELLEQALALVDAGKSAREAARTVGISHTYVNHLRKERAKQRA